MKKIGISKKEHTDLEEIFWALSHASRRHILLSLSKKGVPMLGGEIAEQLSCAWPTTTRHLQTLEKAGLISAQRNGREQIYSLNPERLKIAQHWIDLIVK